MWCPSDSMWDRFKIGICTGQFFVLLCSTGMWNTGMLSFDVMWITQVLGHQRSNFNIYVMSCITKKLIRNAFLSVERGIKAFEKSKETKSRFQRKLKIDFERNPIVMVFSLFFFFFWSLNSRWLWLLLVLHCFLEWLYSTLRCKWVWLCKLHIQKIV